MCNEYESSEPNVPNNDRNLSMLLIGHFSSSVGLFSSLDGVGRCLLC